MTRREFNGIAGRMLGSAALGAACRAEVPVTQDGTIAARPRRGTTTSTHGTTRLGLGGVRDATLQLPAKADATPLPLLVLLHGAGGSGAQMLRRLGSFADEAGVAVLAPDSRDSTWDAIGGEFGPDPAFIDRALRQVFDSVAVDPARVSMGGFSDGATYAISLGLVNGELFTRIVAFSPGFFVGGPVRGKPRIFITHGTADPVLPIDRCSRLIVPALKKASYHVTFRQFDGGHEIPPQLAREGMRFAAGS